jgi:AcrR family transcriptional regulator
VTNAALVRGASSGGRPPIQEAERRLKRLLEVARQHFLAVGFRETSLDGIAREAGVAKKTLYHHFGSKAGLFAAILESLRESWIAELQDVVVRSEEPQVVLEAVALHILEVGTRSDMIALHRLLVAEAHRFPDIVRGHYERGAARDMEPLAGFLRAAVAKGTLTLDDVTLAAEQFTHLVLGEVRMRLLLGLTRRPGQSARCRIARRAVAGYGPVYPVVWEGCSREATPYPDLQELGRSRRCWL